MEPGEDSEVPDGIMSFLEGASTFSDWRVLAGEAVLTQMAFQEMAMPVAPPVIDLNTGYDLLTKEGRESVNKIIERDDPFAITFAPVMHAVDLMDEHCHWEHRKSKDHGRAQESGSLRFGMDV